MLFRITEITYTLAPTHKNITHQKFNSAASTCQKICSDRLSLADLHKLVSNYYAEHQETEEKEKELLLTELTFRSQDIYKAYALLCQYGKVPQLILSPIKRKNSNIWFCLEDDNERYTVFWFVVWFGIKLWFFPELFGGASYTTMRLISDQKKKVSTAREIFTACCNYVVMTARAIFRHVL